MKSVLVILVGILLVLAIAALVAGQAGMLRGRQPTDIGLRSGGLKLPGPGSKNAVSSQSRDPATFIEPIVFEGNPKDAWSTLQAIVRSMPRTTIVTLHDGYLYAEAQTPLLHYVDDMEFLLAAQAGGGRIDMRSASRLGRHDFGVNRARLETVRQAFLAAGKR